MLVSAFVDESRALLFDPAPGAGWSDIELIGYLNEAIQATCFVKPEAYTVVASLTLTAGIVQTIPAGGHALLDVLYNTTSGNAVTQVDKALLEAADPNWKGLAGVLNVEHYTADPRSPLCFYVYPPATALAAVTILYGAVPAALTALGNTIALADAYMPALQDYVQSRAFTKPSSRQDMTKSTSHKQQWGAALGLKSQAQVLLSPKIADGTPT